MFSLEEGAMLTGDLVFWKGRSFPIAWSFGIGFSYHPVYSLAFGFSGLEAIFKEAEFLACYSQEGPISDRGYIICSKGKGWILKTIGIQLGEAFGSLYLHLFIVSWRHYQPYTLFSYFYSRSAPFCTVVSERRFLPA
jgi:hypothetical protein